MREIRTSGSEGRGWKRAYGSRTEHHRESEWTTHRTLRAPRHLLTLTRWLNGVRGVGLGPWFWWSTALWGRKRARGCRLERLGDRKTAS